jgi:hypothetical protein
MTVEDGRPFCPQCRAPQIHVQVPDRGPAAAQQSSTHSSADEFSPEILQAPHPAPPLGIAGILDKAIATRAAVKAGVIGFFLGMLIPFVAIVVAGGLAVFFYRRESGFVLPAALASRIGGAAGVVAVAIQSLFFTIYIFIFHRQQEYVDSVTRFVHTVGGDASVSDIQASIRSLFTPAGLIVTLIFVMIVAVILASAGGALASLFFRPRKPQL